MKHIPFDGWGVMFGIGILMLFGTVGASDAGLISPTRELLQICVAMVIVLTAGHYGGFFRKGGADK